ncbi:gliding motility protein RemB [Mucilaginibacter frigoritolerans]|nr:gliding motility protein RemB [Mucilaginibacter frigoritolerans]
MTQTVLFPMVIKKWAIKFFAIGVVLICSCKLTYAQIIYQPYSFQFYQKLNDQLYFGDSNLHTAVKPYLISDSSSLRITYDSLMNLGVDTNRKSWLSRKLFNEHGFDDRNKDFTFYADYLPDLQIGKDLTGKKNTYLNTRGFQVGGTIGTKFFFYTSAYENQGTFPAYLTNYIHTIGLIPGQASEFTLGTPDWSYATSLIGFNLSKSVSLVAGVDKTFIGDGYRSLLLSDFAANYPLFRATFSLGKHVQYMAMWALLQDQSATQFPSQHAPYRKKWAAFHYIDWTITNRASLGFFNAIITADADDNGSRHPFDVNFINPILFSKSLGPSTQIPDHTLLGFNGKYKVLDKTTLYGQLLFDQETSTASSGTEYGYQLGLRGADLFKVHAFNYLLEYNTVKPYTYSSQYPLVNYTQFNETLGDPLGANFKELVGILNYSMGKFDFQGELTYAKLGLDANNISYGGDILLPSGIAPTSVPGFGTNTTLKYAEGKVAYLINPKYNLRFELGLIYRNEDGPSIISKTTWITFGLRSTFRDIYSDF